MNFFRKFFDFFKTLNIKNRIKKLNKFKEQAHDVKSVLDDGVELDIDFQAPKSEFELEVENIIRECDWNQKLIVEYIKGNGTPVHIFRLGGKILDAVGENEGFITPILGFRALFLNIIINHKIAFQTEPMFVMSKIPEDIYILIYELFKWYSYKKGLPGYDIKTQNLFKKVWLLEQDENVDKLGYKQILSLKEAIKRDFEAINFAKKLAFEKGK